MKLTTVILAGWIVFAVKFDRIWNFDKDEVGKLPKGWTKVVGKWSVVKDADAPTKPNVLAQQAKSENSVFNIAVVNEVNLKNVEVSVKFKAVAGNEDRGGGVVWRYKDKGNYYICRANPLEDNFRVYKVVNGQRIQLKSANVKLESGKWHAIKAVMTVDRIKCFYDGKLLLNVKDRTFSEAGKAGLWTKSDAQTHFDDFHVTEAPVMTDIPPRMVEPNGKSPQKKKQK